MKIYLNETKDWKIISELNKLMVCGCLYSSKIKRGFYEAIIRQSFFQLIKNDKRFKGFDMFENFTLTTEIGKKEVLLEQYK